MDRLDEALAIAKAMFTQDRPTFEGRHYQVTSILNVPKPIQAGGPPILVGGGGEQRTLKIAAKYADMTHWFPLGREALRHKKDVLARHCEAIGRDPGDDRADDGDAGRRRPATTPSATRSSPGSPTERRAARDRRRDPRQCADGLQPYLDDGFTGFTFNNPLYRTPEQIALVGELLSSSRPSACVRPFRFLAEPGDVADGKALVEAAHRAESIGYDVMVYPDHVVLPFGLVPLLATVAAVTERLRVSAVRRQQRPPPPGAARPGHGHRST